MLPQNLRYNVFIHTFLMLKQGVHPKIVQERLGHASIQVTLDTYRQIPGLQEAAAKGFDEIISYSNNLMVKQSVSDTID